MSRIVRERGSVGRRIWRRRARRRADGSAPGIEGADPDLPPFAPPEDPHAHDDEPAHEEAVGTRAKPGFFSSLKERLFGGGGGREERAPPGPIAPSVASDPVGEVLSVPRGAARLDAFERALTQATPGQPVHKDLALAFFRELSSLSEQAGIDLSLLEDRVDACAQALLAAGEDERAGALFLRMGARHRAVELFVKAGAVEQLEETYAHIHWEEGGAKHDARLAFERFEALFVVGMRDQALASLERAVKLWGDNPVYTEVHQSFLARLGAPHRKLLRAGRHELWLHTKWPLVIGRGEEAAVRLTSPLLSRAHVQLVREGGAPCVQDLDSKGGTRVDDVALSATSPLGAQGAIDMGGVVVRYQLRADAVVLLPALHPERATWALLGARVTVPQPDGSDGTNELRFDAQGRALLVAGGLLNDERIARDTLLLEGDRVGPWTVARA